MAICNCAIQETRPYVLDSVPETDYGESETILSTQFRTHGKGHFSLLN